MVQIYHWKPKHDELIGEFECPMNRLLTAPRQTVKSPLFLPDHKRSNKHQRGIVTLNADSVSDSNHQAIMKMQAHIIFPKNDKKQGFLCFCQPPRDRPYLVIEKASSMDPENFEWIRVHKSEEYEDDLDPLFQKDLNLTMLCDKNEKLPLKFSLFSLVDIDENKSLPYGSMQTTLAEIKNFKPDKEIELINEKGK